MLRVLSLLLVGLVTTTVQAFHPAPIPQTLEELCQQRPRMVSSLFSALDLKQPGLEKVSKALDKRNTPAACRALIAYYQTSPKYQIRRLFPEHEKIIPSNEQEENLLLRRLTFQESSGALPLHDEEWIDWSYSGPKGDPEWWGMLQRHSFSRPLLAAWTRTGDDRFASAFSRYITDWIAQNPRPVGGLATGGWETMLMARRISDAWAPAFHEFQMSKGFSDVARIMLLASAHEQLEFLTTHLSMEGNHLNAELLGIAAGAVAWSEFRHSRQWLDFVVERKRQELDKRVYPDGFQKELSNHYQIIVANHTEFLARLLLEAKHPATMEMYHRADKLWSAVASVMQPDGHGPLNNDGDLEDNQYHLQKAEEARTIFQGPKLMSSLPTDFRISKDSGQETLRQGEDQIFFDTGPLGTAHQHYDKLHLSAYIRNRSVLVDSGRYTYRIINAWRRYFTGPWGHNVVIVDDGRAPLEPHEYTNPPKQTIRPHALAGTVYFRPSGLFPERPIRHTRTIQGGKGYWLVVDEIEATGQHSLSIPWHFHPNCEVKLDSKTQAVETNDAGKGNLRIIPISIDGSGPDRVELIKGQTSPFVLGWYSPEYNVRIPTSVALYKKKISGPAVLVWLLIPGGDRFPEISAQAGLLKTQEGWQVKLTVNKPKTANQRAEQRVFEIPLGE